MSMRVGGTLLGGAIAVMCTFVFGFGMGSDFTRDSVKPKVVVEERERVIYKSKPAEIPDQCMYAMQELASLRAAYDGITASSGDKQIDLMSDAQVAMLQHDFKRLNALAEVQRGRSKQLAGAAIEVAQRRDQFDRYMKSCKKQLEDK